MKRAYDDETFLPWYRRPSATWLELSAPARGVLVSVAMELSQKRGELTLRRGLESLAVIVRIPWPVLGPALDELIAVGKLAWDPAEAILSDPEYLDRARPTSKERVAKHREAKVAADAEREEDQKRREEKRREVTLQAAGCEAETPVTPVTLPALRDGDGARVLGLDGEGGAAWHAWRSGISLSTGKPTSEIGARDKPDLVAFTNAHSGGLRGQDLIDWIAATAAAFAGAVDGKYGGFTTKRCRDWLDAGRPERATNGAPRQPIGSAASAPWMNPTSNFDFGASK